MAITYNNAILQLSYTIKQYYDCKVFKKEVHIFIVQFPCFQNVLKSTSVHLTFLTAQPVQNPCFKW